MMVRRDDFIDYSEKPSLLKFRSSNSFIAAVVCLAVFSDIFLYGVIVPLLPVVLNQRAGIPDDQTQIWISVLLGAYGGALFIASPVCGYLGDQTSSRQTPFLIGLVILGVGTGLLCIGSSISLFIAGRFLQGVSGALVWVVGLALLVDTVGKEGIAGYMGSVSTALTLGILSGPLLGGLLFDAGGYYAVFGLAFAILGLDIVLRLAMIDRKTAERYQAVMTSSIRSGYFEENPPEENEEHQVSVDEETALLAPTREGAPKIPWKYRLPPTIWLLTSARLLVALFATMTYAIVTTGFDAILPLLVKTTFEWNTIGGGLIFLPLCLPSLLSYYAGTLADKYGPRYIAALGFIIMAPPLVLLRLINANNIKQQILLCSLLAIVGVGLAMVLPAIMAEITYVVEDKAKDNKDAFRDSTGAIAQAYGLFNGSFAFGTLVGPIFTGYIKNAAGLGTMGWSVALLACVTSLPVLLVTGNSSLQVKDRLDGVEVG